MSSTPRLLAFGGSLRRDSFNQKLAAAVAEGAREAGAEVTLIALRDYPLPLFDADIEAADGMPENARKLKTLFREHHGLIIASPEYNSSITAALKNAIDWVSRAETGDEAPAVAFAGKTALLCAASPGAIGGLRGLVHIRAILGNLGIILMPDQFALGKANEAFADDGTIKDAKMAARTKALGVKLARLTAKLID